jgi:hypothetical protein
MEAQQDSVVVRLRSTFSAENIAPLYDYLNDREKAALSRLSPAFLNQTNPIPEAVSLMRTAHPHAKPGWHIVASWAGKTVSPETALDAYEALLNEWTIHDHYWGAVAHGNTDRWHVHGFAILQHPESRDLVRVRFRHQQIARIMRDFGFAYDERARLHLPAGARDAETWNGQYSFARFVKERLDPTSLRSWADLDQFLGAYGIERQKQKSGFILVDASTPTTYRVKASSVGLAAALTRPWGTFPEQRRWPKVFDSYGQLVSRGDLLDPSLSAEQLARHAEWTALRAEGATRDRYGYWLRRGTTEGMMKHGEDATDRGDNMDGTRAFTRDELVRGLEARLAELRNLSTNRIAALGPGSGHLELTRAHLYPPAADAPPEAVNHFEHQTRRLDALESAVATRGIVNVSIYAVRGAILEDSIDLQATEVIERTQRILDVARTLPAGEFRLPARHTRGSDDAQIDFRELDLDSLESLVGLSVDAVTTTDINAALADAHAPEAEHERKPLASDDDRARLGRDLLAAVNAEPTWQAVYHRLAPYGLTYGPYYGRKNGNEYRGGGIYAIAGESRYQYYARPSDLDRKLGINGLEARLGPIVADRDPRARQTLGERAAEINANSGNAMDAVHLAAFRDAAARHQAELAAKREGRPTAAQAEIRDGQIPEGFPVTLERPPYTIVARDPQTGRYIEICPSQTIAVAGDSRSTSDHYVSRIHARDIDPLLLPNDQHDSRHFPEIRWDTDRWIPSPTLNLADRTIVDDRGPVAPPTPAIDQTAASPVLEQPVAAPTIENTIGGPQEGRLHEPINEIAGQDAGRNLHDAEMDVAVPTSDVVLAAHRAYGKYLGDFEFGEPNLNAAFRSLRNTDKRVHEQLAGLRDNERDGADAAEIAQQRLDKLQRYAVEQERMALTIAMHERPIETLYPKTYAEFVANYSEFDDQDRLTALEMEPPHKDRTLFAYDESYAAILQTSYSFDEERGIGRFVDQRDSARTRFTEHAGRFALARKPQTSDIDVALRMAEARWGSITLKGDDEFVARAYERALMLGIPVANEEELTISPTRMSQIRTAFAARNPKALVQAVGSHLIAAVNPTPEQRDRSYAQKIRDRVAEANASRPTPIIMPKWADSLRPISSEQLDAAVHNTPNTDRAAALDTLRIDRLAALVQNTPLSRGRPEIGVPSGSTDFVGLTTVTHATQPYLIAKLGDATHIAKLPPSQETRQAVSFNKRLTLTSNGSSTTAELSTVQRPTVQREASLSR